MSHLQQYLGGDSQASQLRHDLADALGQPQPYRTPSNAGWLLWLAGVVDALTPHLGTPDQATRVLALHCGGRDTLGQLRFRLLEAVGRLWAEDVTAEDGRC